MSSPVAELEAGLQGMLGLKPPGVSGSRITAITALCVANVQSESVLIQKIYTHFKKTPGTHKLGVLYVVDSVTRKWMDQAKQQGQAINSSAQDGTFAAGVNRVTELMPVLMNDITATAPADQKEKIKKLVDIWEKGQTFPTAMLETFKQKLNTPTQNQSTTPPGSPPPNLMASLNGQARPAAAQAPPAVPANIMEALAKIARQNTTTQQSAPPVPAVAGQIPHTSATPTPPFSLAGAAHAPPPVPPQPQLNMLPGTYPFQPVSQPPAQPVNAQPLPFQIPPPVQSGQVPNPGMPAANPGSAAVNPAVASLLATLMAQGLPAEQITAIVSQVMASTNAAAPGAPQYPAPAQSSYPGAVPTSAAGGWAAQPRPDESRDRPYPDSRSPRGRGRSRSRSPGRRWDARDSPRGRGEDRGYGDYGRRSSPGRGRAEDRDRTQYRQRSPAGRRGSSPHRDGPPQPGEKWVEYDNTLPNGTIRVLSRTLFVGGVTCSEAELRAIFARYGEVQTCIVNKEKRHAFVKMYTRKAAVAAKEGMEDARTQELPLRTRWGVGFGPRDCSDYQSGISVIPISKLTEADRKWMLTAPWGGSGGKPIVTGMVVEEPDIEIGAGVSSKAISRRMATDRGGLNGPRSSRKDEENHHDGGSHGSGHGSGHGNNHGGGRFNRRGGGGGGSSRDHRRGDDDRNKENVNTTTPGFGFGLAVGPNGMPIFPPGFAFPAPDGQTGPNY
ncbi:uncharacterized protein E0L32_008064 [Thyridium curvatum]|uniref:Uncharacterized protein n=1 Tax=Thyridium curvatum TaxID=1093900 RepID=A0A507AU57_9PEZI|nr:uncharacterized protein E0L32_008064 [Thyridium curvatum]TPX11027.1 hypothetical protein E0L32_008064 [Thyridium curvatum]